MQAYPGCLGRGSGDAMLPEMDQAKTSAARDTLRAAGFLVTVAGSLLAGVGALRAWAEIGLEGNRAGVISPTYLGVDLLEGKIAIALALIAVTGVLLARAGRTGSRRWAAVVVLVSGVAILATAGELALAGSDRLERDAVARTRDALREHAAEEEVIDDAVALVEARLKAGVWVSMAGGALVAVGGSISLAWARGVPTPAGDKDTPFVGPEI
jgi:hypothetical protein